MRLCRLYLISLVMVLAVLQAPLLAQEKKTFALDPNCNSTCSKIQEIGRSKFVVFIFAEKADGTVIATGSGFLVRDESVWHIVTNHHVVSHNSVSKLWISFRGVPGFRETHVLGSSPGADLALLEAPDIPRGVHAAELGERLLMGQQLYAVGYPFGGFDISAGYVNSAESDSWLYVWSQAPVNPGSSGGPVLNESLQVVGVNTAIIAGNVTPKTLVLPVEYVHLILPRLKTEHLVRHGWLGLNLTDAARLSPSFFRKWGLPYRPYELRVFVTNVPPKSTAAKAGLQEGDVILKFNQWLVSSQKDLEKKIFFDYRPGQEVLLLVERGGQVLERRLTLEEFKNPLHSAGGRESPSQ